MMRPITTRILKVLGMVVILAGLPWLLFYLWQTPQSQLPYRHVAPDIDARIESRQVNVLRNETLEQSLKQLAEVEMFFWPGGYLVQASSPTLPLPASTGDDVVGFVMSNRRFLKIVHELGSLPREKAARLMNSAIGAAMVDYRKLYDADCALKAKIMKAGVVPTSSGGFQISNNPDGSPTLMGARLQVLALVLAAGNLELEETLPAVLEVAREGLAQYRELCRADKYNSFSAHAMITGGSLYNRQLLGAGLAGTAKRLSAKEPTPPNVPLNWVVKELPHYDAHATPYDLHAKVGVVPVDFSRGRITVRYLGPLDDSRFNDLVDWAAKRLRQ